jgi:hypothetical protein
VGQAAAIKIGYEASTFVPYVSYRYHSEHFVYRDRFSAHLLRTALQDESHGGLDRYGIGAYFRSGQFVINQSLNTWWLRTMCFLMLVILEKTSKTPPSRMMIFRYF